MNTGTPLCCGARHLKELRMADQTEKPTRHAFGWPAL